jgi:hypothetical protein
VSDRQTDRKGQQREVVHGKKGTSHATLKEASWKTTGCAGAARPSGASVRRLREWRQSGSHDTYKLSAASALVC